MRELGSAWSDQGRGTWRCVPVAPQPEIWARMDNPNPEFSVHGNPPSVGARMDGTTVCTRCGQHPEADQLWIADMKPDMAGTWHHRVCPRDADGQDIFSAIRALENFHN